MDTAESKTFAARLAELLRNEQHAMAGFLQALAEFDLQRGWVVLGYANLFDFLVRDLGLSRGTAHYRKTAARLIQRYPEVLSALRDGALCVTAIVELAKVITPENRLDVLPRFLHRSKQEARAVSAELSPRPIVPRREVVTQLPSAAITADEAGDIVTSREAPSEDRVSVVQPVELPLTGATPSPASPPPVVQPAPHRPSADPLTATAARLHLTVSPAFLKKLDAARLALSHAKPGATVEDVLTAGLDLLLEQAARRRGLVKHPRPAAANSPADPGSDHVPAAVRRAVWERDQGRCQWPVEGGGVCGSELRVEIDHVKLRCRGGKHELGALRLLCDLHNKLSARLELGDELMDRYTRDPRQPGLFGETGRS